MTPAVMELGTYLVILLVVPGQMPSSEMKEGEEYEPPELPVTGGCQEHRLTRSDERDKTRIPPQTCKMPKYLRYRAHQVHLRMYNHILSIRQDTRRRMTWAERQRDCCARCRGICVYIRAS